MSDKKTQNIELTPKERLFCFEFVADKDLNAERAAIKAGYAKTTARTKAFQWVSKSERNSKPHVIAFINELMGKREKKIEKKGDWVISKLTEVAERCLQEIDPVLNQKGEQVFTKNKEGDYVPAFTFNANGANKSLELLGKHFGVIGDKLDVNGKLTLEDYVIQRYQKKIAENEG